MDLVADLLPVLVGLYLLDGVLRVRSGQVLFFSKGRGRFTGHGPGLRLSGLWPTSEAFLTASLPLRANAEGIVVRAGSRGERTVAFAGMGTVTAEGDRVWLGADCAFDVATRGMAAELAETIERLRVAPPRRRFAALRRALRRRCSASAFRSLRATQARHMRVLKGLSAAFFLALFVALPASFVPELPLRTSPLAAAALAGFLYAAVLFVSARMLTRCGLPARAVASRLLPLVLFPPAAAHAASQVSRDLFLGFEPAAAAAVLLDAESFRAMARRRRADRLLAEDGSADQDGATWSVGDVAWGLVLQAARQSDADLLVPPLREDATAGAFCPICHAEYRPGFFRCSDCGVPLQVFTA